MAFFSKPDHKLEPPCAEIGPNNVDDVLDYVNWAMDTVRSSNTDAWDAVVFSDNPHNALTGEEPLLPVKYFGMLFCFELVKEGFIESADIPFERLGFEVLVRHFVCDIRRCLNHPFIVVAEQWALKPLVIGRGHIIIIARTFRIGPTCFVLLNSCPRTLFSH